MLSPRGLLGKRVSFMTPAGRRKTVRSDLEEEARVGDVLFPFRQRGSMEVRKSWK